MSHGEFIPLAERKHLREKMIKKHNIANILTHWFNAGMGALLILTGVGILFSPRLGIVPDVWLTFVRNVFGGTANLIKFHYTIGLIWMAVMTFNILVGFRKYFIPFARNRMMLDKDDIEWLKVKPFQMMGFMKDKPLPPQDAYNAGQKIYSYVAVAGSFVIGLTGVIMTFHEYVPWPWLLQWAQPVHFGAMGAIIAGWLIHVYMGAVFPEEKEAFFSMFTGKVSALYARLHHPKWYWRYMTGEAEWEDSILEEGRQLSEESAAAD
jgi:formate dehydrogenase subunit gamma